MNEQHPIVSRTEWLTARKELLAREKEFTKLGDELNAERRNLPWERVEKRYAFETETGTKTLAELFGDQEQLLVYHFMFAPEWEQGCKSCAFWADNFDGIVPHLEQRGVRFVAVSRAPLAKLRAFEERLGWSFSWVSSGESDFNFDYGVSFRPDQRGPGKATYNYEPTRGTFEEREGISVFTKNASGEVFHTYSSFARGVEMVNAAYRWLDLVPKGRDEANLPYPMSWLKLRDDYAR